jgi:putative transposase
VGGALRATARRATPRQAAGKAGRSWHVDETYIRVHGRWCYLYRAVDRDDHLVDSLLSETPDLKAARRFFRGARPVVGHAPDRVTTDGHDAYPRAIRRTLGRQVVHRRNRFLNNRLEQDHRGIKQRYYPMRVFGSFEAAARFCHAHDGLRDYLRPRRTLGEVVSLTERRHLFRDRWTALIWLIAAYSVKYVVRPRGQHSQPCALLSES